MRRATPVLRAVIVIVISGCAPAHLGASRPTLDTELGISDAVVQEVLAPKCTLTDEDGQTRPIPDCYSHWLDGEQVSSGRYTARLEGRCQTPTETTLDANAGGRVKVDFAFHPRRSIRYVQRAGVYPRSGDAFFRRPFGMHSKPVELRTNTRVSVLNHLPDEKNECTLAAAVVIENNDPAYGTPVIIALNVLSEEPGTGSSPEEQRLAEEQTRRDDERRRKVSAESERLATVAADHLEHKRFAEAHRTARECLKLEPNLFECTEAEKKAREQLRDKVPHHIKDVAAYREGDGLLAYFSLIDDRGAYLRLDGRATVDVVALTRGIVVGEVTVASYAVTAADFQEAEIGIGRREAVIASRHIRFTDIYARIHSDPNVARAILEGWRREHDLEIRVRFFDVLGTEHIASSAFAP